MSTSRFLFIAALLALPASAPSSAWARHGQDDRQEDDSRRPNNGIGSTDDSSERGQIKVDRRTKFKRGVLRSDDFSAKVEIPVPLLVGGVTNVSDASAADVEAHFARGGVEFAVCQLGLDELEEEDDNLQAEYKVDIRTEVKNGVARTRVKHGSCDTNLLVPGSENSIPDLREGDAVTVFVNGAEVPLRTRVRLR